MGFTEYVIWNTNVHTLGFGKNYSVQHLGRRLKLPVQRTGRSLNLSKARVHSLGYSLDTAPLMEAKEALKAEMAKLNDEIERLIRDNASHPQDQLEYSRRFNELTSLLERKEAETAALEQQISERLGLKGQINIFLSALKQTDEELITTFRASTWHALVDYGAVMADKTIVFHMRNGSTITVPLEEAQRRK